MNVRELLGTQSVIITLDIFDNIFDKIDLCKELNFSLIEVNTTDIELFRQLILSYPDMKIGAGMITNADQLEAFYKIGAAFLTSPGFLPNLAQTAAVYKMHYLPGISTISEAMKAAEFNCVNIRPFPADIDLCMQLNKYLPAMNLLPAEIEWRNAKHFLNLPSVTAISIINPKNEQLLEIGAGILT
jgi:2-dehydro-3-deoxyphosphogluconate aldolase / (4S)-4-hydroxy-2-oxoglutarate aldolase